MTTMLAGRVQLDAVMAQLTEHRPVFHSEADFQFAFAQTLATLDQSIDVRLEVPYRAERRTYVDLRCAADDHTTLVEFKYITRTWAGSAGPRGEEFELRGHEALDLARLHFIHDVYRLEGWTSTHPNTNGVAILLTNDNRLWEPPRTAKLTRDHAYRVHQGQTITGELAWGTAERPYAANNRTIRGTYGADWRSYSNLDDRPGGELRWLAWQVTR
jgi:hypothetical protein